MKPMDPRVSLLLSIADDEFILGYRDSEWTGIAPMLEEDVALSSMSQDEVGHARALYELAAELDGRSPDALAYGREPREYLHCQLVERPRGDWAYTMARQFLYDAADSARTQAATRSAHAPLAQVAAKILREEKYHRMHGETWMRKLAHGTQESRSRLEAALTELWPDLTGFFEPVAGEEALLRDGTWPVPMRELVVPWWAGVTAVLEEHGLPIPAGAPGCFQDPVPGGRSGRHSPAFSELLEEMTSVYRSDPGATW